MFFYQSKTAVKKLQEQPMLEKTEYKNLNNIVKPLLTICPEDQYDRAIIFELGYSMTLNEPSGFLIGRRSREYDFSWQAWKNITFMEMVSGLLRYDLEDDIAVTKNEAEFMPYKYYPRFGYCWEILDYSTDLIFHVLWPKSVIGDVKVYITDRHLSTFNSFDRSTDMEYAIELDRSGVYTYRVNIELASNFDPRTPEACREYKDDEYAECKENENEKEVQTLFGCNPPWISRHNQCKENISLTPEKDYEWSKLFKKIYDGLEKNIYNDSGCKKPCTVIQSYAKKRSFKPHDFGM